MTETTREYLAQLSLVWHGFRLAELKAAAQAADVPLSIDEDQLAAFQARADSVLLRVRVTDEAHVRRLATRTVLCKGFVDEWACGASWDELSTALRAYPREHAAPYLAAGTTFKVIVTSFGKKNTDAERMDLIKMLEPLLPWQGKVNLKTPDFTFVLFCDTPLDGATSKATEDARPFFHFGRLVAEGRRDLVGRYDLKKRNYIGTTSLDAELSLLMANLARVRAGDLVYDPYCGTAGTLVAAAAFGARVLGCDLHLPAIKGQLRTRSGPSKLKQAAVQGIPETFSQYGLPPVVDRLHGDSGAHLAFFRERCGGLFEAIISDPPYGIRERPSEVDDSRLLGRALAPEHYEGHVPRTAIAALEQILTDLFSLSTRTLKPGGRLVFLLPTTEPFSASLLPRHPGLVIEAACEQLMAARWSRWCIVMRRMTDVEAAASPAVTLAMEGRADICDSDGLMRDLDTVSTSVAQDGGEGGASIFNRASLRPDDKTNGKVDSAVAAAATVLHPHLLGKSAGARKRHEKWLAAATAEQTGPVNVSGSTRSKRRQDRSKGRGEYEAQVRDRLTDIHNGPGGGDGSRLPRLLVRAGLLVALAALALAAAARKSRPVLR